VGPTADVDDQRAGRLGHRQAGPNRGGHRLLDQVRLAGAGRERQASSTARFSTPVTPEGTQTNDAGMGEAVRVHCLDEVGASICAVTSKSATCRPVREAEIVRGAAQIGLRLDELQRRRDRARGVRQIVALGDPVGEVIDGRRLPNGLDVRKVRVPLGVVAVVYEARPNVTIDATALCLKSGNAIVLRGSPRPSTRTAALAQSRGAGGRVGGPARRLCQPVWPAGGRAELAELATQKDTVDLIIPRGGEGLKEALEAVATVPVIYAASGNCHVYVDASAELARAEEIVMKREDPAPGGVQRRRDAARSTARSRPSSSRESSRRSEPPACWCARTSARWRSRSVPEVRRSSTRRPRPRRSWSRPQRRIGEGSTWR